MNTRLAQLADKEKWDSYVQNHPEASAYHLWAWKDSIAEAYNHNGYYLIAEQGDHIGGVLPLIHMKLPLLQNKLVALPFCDVGGPLTDSGVISTLLLKQAVSLCTKLGARKLEVRTLSSSYFENQHEAISETEQGIQYPSKVSMHLNLPDTSEDLWNGFKSKLRSQICKAEKNDLTFKWGQYTNIASFYSIFSKNMHELGSPVHSITWIKSVLRNYGANAKIGLVFSKDQPVGCGIILLCGKTVAIPWASTLRNFNNLGPNMLLYWNFLKYSADNGYSTFDFGRSTPGEGTFRFKTQWGAKPQMLHWFRIHSNGSVTHKEFSAPSTNVNRAQLAVLWTKLPLWAANFLGPIFRRHISL